MDSKFKNFLDIGKDVCEFNLPGWSEWERAAKNLPELIENGKLRELVFELPRVNLDGLTVGQVKRAYCILTFIAHGYIRGNQTDNVLTRLPEIISENWIKSGKLLGVPPVATYSATVLFNCRSRIEEPTEPEDFEVQFTFTGTEDEKWFYAVSAAIDAQSRKIIERTGDLADIIDELTRILNRMYERCGPAVFYGQVRRYLAGWFNDSDLLDGLIYELSDGNCVTMKLAGGSAAQNPTIQLLDILLGVKHGEDTDDLMISGFNGCPRMNYLGAMRTYMPKEHSNYLNRMESEMRGMVRSDGNYEKSVRALCNFRTEHLIMVSRFITSKDAKGTGGSNPIPFLKKCRRETEEKLQ